MSEIEKTDQEWQTILSPLAYKVTRKHGTERAFSHDDFPQQAGYFTCVCCGAHLFSQAAKFDSGTGWPSFTKSSPGRKSWRKRGQKLVFNPHRSSLPNL